MTATMCLFGIIIVLVSMIFMQWVRESKIRDGVENFKERINNLITEKESVWREHERAVKHIRAVEEENQRLADKVLESLPPIAEYTKMSQPVEFSEMKTREQHIGRYMVYVDFTNGLEFVDWEFMDRVWKDKIINCLDEQIRETIAKLKSKAS